MAVHYALNIGCGNDYRESTEDIEWVNLDKGDCKKDISQDIELPPYRFSDNYFDSIHAIQVLEHIEKHNFIPVIRELYRISKDGCIWDIQVPHAFSDNFITDPTHKMPYSVRTFDYFINGTPLRENGLIYGWGDISLIHSQEPEIDGNHSIKFLLMVKK